MKYLLSILFMFILSCDKDEYKSIHGCTDIAACNYNCNANIYNFACIYEEENYDCDGNCIVELDCMGQCGGTSIFDCNDECDGNAEIDECDECIVNGSLNIELWNETCSGCLDEQACNYNDLAIIEDNSSCFYPHDLAGDLCNCPDMENYYEDAIIEDDCGICLSIECCEVGSEGCVSIESYNENTQLWSLLNGNILLQNPCATMGHIENGNIWVVGNQDWNTSCGPCYGLGNDDFSCLDACGIPYGDNLSCTDECGVINGDNTSCVDCLGEINGSATIDNCGNCDDNPANDCTPDCLGIWGGGAIEDECGICNGNNTICADQCGIPWGDNSTCSGCNNIYAENYSYNCNNEYIDNILIDDGCCLESSITLYPDFSTILPTDLYGNIDGDIPEGIYSACYELDLYKGSNTDNLPTELSLSAPYPNLFDTSINIDFSIAHTTECKIFIIDNTNTTIEILYNGTIDSGNHTINWDGSSNGNLVDNGFYRVIVDIGAYECFANIQFEDNPYGCMDDTLCDYGNCACNYDPYTIIKNNDLCIYPIDNYDCNDNCLLEYDECDVCGGNGPEENFDCDGSCLIEIDECGECGGSGIVDGACDCDGNVPDCAGECGGLATIDNCGTCDTDFSNDCIQDCTGEWGGNSTEICNEIEDLCVCLNFYAVYEQIPYISNFSEHINSIKDDCNNETIENNKDIYLTHIDSSFIFYPKISSSNILISAPHSQRTDRCTISDVHSTDLNTGIIAKILHEYTGSAAIYKNYKSDDPNYYDYIPQCTNTPAFIALKDSSMLLPYKQKLNDYIIQDSPSINFVMDLHGYARTGDIDLGTMYGESLQTNHGKLIPYIINYILDQEQISLTIDDEFPAYQNQTVTKFVTNVRNDIDAAQFEIESRYRINCDSDDFTKSILSLIKIIEVLNWHYDHGELYSKRN